MIITNDNAETAQFDPRCTPLERAMAKSLLEMHARHAAQAEARRTKANRVNRRRMRQSAS